MQMNKIHIDQLPTPTYNWLSGGLPSTLFPGRWHGNKMDMFDSIEIWTRYLQGPHVTPCVTIGAECPPSRLVFRESQVSHVSHNSKVRNSPRWDPWRRVPNAWRRCSYDDRSVAVLHGCWGPGACRETMGNSGCLVNSVIRFSIYYICMII